MLLELRQQGGVTSNGRAELAEECGACYHRYGAALFYRAQEEGDLFGAPLRQAALSAEPQGTRAAAAPATTALGQSPPCPLPCRIPLLSMQGRLWVSSLRVRPSLGGPCAVHAQPRPRCCSTACHM